MGRYLNLNALRPGDVILSSAPTTRSLAIRCLTGFAPVSHAAIAIHPLIWFESVGECGVRYVSVKPELVLEGSCIRVGMKIARGENFIVRRPRDPLVSCRSANEPHKIARELIKISSKYAFLNYATPDAFLPMLRFGLGEATLLRVLANKLSARVPRAFSGPFCSWLVADCYRDLKWGPFDGEPITVNPGTLARSTNLESVQCVFRGRRVEPDVRFAGIVERTRTEIELAAGHIAMLSGGARIARSTVLLNSAIAGLAERALHRSGSTIPAALAQNVRKIEEREIANFKMWQDSTIAMFDAHYPSVAACLTEMSAISSCQESCKKPWAAGQSCGQVETDTCHMAAQQYRDALLKVYDAFPNPEPIS